MNGSFENWRETMILRRKTGARARRRAPTEATVRARRQLARASASERNPEERRRRRLPMEGDENGHMSTK